MTVFENVEFPLKANKVPAAERHARVLRFLSMVGVHNLAERFPSKLSGGEQQRVALARALVGQPATVLMDEPLASLDEDSRGSLCDHIAKLHFELGFALVYVTHSRMEASAIGGRIIHVDSI